MKNKLIVSLTVGFALLFITFVVRITDEMSNSHKNILNSQNVIDVTNEISTHIYVTNEDLPVDGNWTKPNFDTQKWQAIRIPSYQIVKMKDFKEGNFAYYRIQLPEIVFDKIKHLQNESYLALQSVYYSRVDIVLNGRFFGTNRPVRSMEAKLNLPVIENEDNVICLKGYIKTGDTGIDHRNKIMLGKGAEFNEVHRASYKAQTVFQLVFILCKGSILFIFALIYLLLKVDASFEKFFIFGFCAVLEELIAGDYFYGPLNFNQMVYFYNLVNAGATIAVFLFFAELLSRSYSLKLIKFISVLLIVISTLLATDALFWNHTVDISKYMKFWNLLTVSVLIYFAPKVIKFDRILFIGLVVSISLYLWGALPTNNIGLNFKAYGNLLLFFMVAYQTFALFRRDQNLLQLKEKQLLAQEKDVAIGKTASLLAHDVRKPLEQMRLVMDKVLSGDADKEFLNIAKEDIEFSIAGVDRQVNDIMNISRTAEVSLVETSFYKLLAHSIKQVMSVHQEMDLKLEYELEANRKILSDPSRLSSALVNLISNAVEAIRDIGNTYKGTIRFKTAHHKDQFVFKIYNNGPEIPRGIMNNIFNPLFTHGKASGTGLGLTSVFKTTSEHGGAIKVENVNNGVEFTLCLQSGQEVDEFNLDAFQASSKNYNYDTPRFNLNIQDVLSLNILLLEESKDSIKYYESLIQHLPYKVKLDVAKEPSIAEELISKSRYDLYLLSVDAGGIALFQKKLSYLSHEVVLYSTLSIPNIKNLNCEYFNKLVPKERMIEISKNVHSKRLKILFVDDTKLFRVAWQMFHGDHNIKCIGSPEEAIQLLSDTTVEFGAYVLDYHFANSSMDGEFLAEKILELRQGALVLISSSTDQQIEGLQFISKRDYEVRRVILSCRKN